MGTNGDDGGWHGWYGESRSHLAGGPLRLETVLSARARSLMRAPGCAGASRRTMRAATAVETSDQSAPSVSFCRRQHYPLFPLRVCVPATIPCLGCLGLKEFQESQAPRTGATGTWPAIWSELLDSALPSIVLCVQRAGQQSGVWEPALAGEFPHTFSPSVTAPSSETRRTAEAQCFSSFVSVRLKTRSDTTLTRNDARLASARCENTHRARRVPRPSSLFPLPFWSTAPSGCSLVDLPSDATFSAPRPSARPALACSPDCRLQTAPRPFVLARTRQRE